jgi:ribose transport system ATP-binding protein
MSDISVTFGATKALAGVNFDVRTGEVHALLGGNGSGKSTLIKVLAGIQPADHGGTITLAGQFYNVEDMDPEIARSSGLRFVHQDLGMFDDMTVAENFALYAQYPQTRLKRVSWRALHSYVAVVLDRFEIAATPRMQVGELRPAARTMLAVARALHDDEGESRLLVLDEPTASLPDHEVELLLDSLRRRTALGQTILYVSHRLREVLAFADELTVLRDGRSVASRSAASISEREVVELIAGRAIDRLYPESAPVDATEPIVVLEALNAGPIRDFDLAVLPGEVVGIAGLLGSGRSSLLRAMFGDLPSDATTVRVGRARGPFRSPRHAMRAGVAYVPEDRRGDAAFLDQSVRENLSIASVRRYFRWFVLRRSLENRDSRRFVEQFLIKTASVTSPLYSLSGGNQQKVILARWMTRQPALLLLDEPTQGVDVVARADIYRLIRAVADTGSGVVIVSSDLEELAHICDRALIVSRGRLVREVRREQLSPELLYQLIQPQSEMEVA